MEDVCVVDGMGLELCVEGTMDIEELGDSEADGRSDDDTETDALGVADGAFDIEDAGVIDGILGGVRDGTEVIMGF